MSTTIESANGGNLCFSRGVGHSPRHVISWPLTATSMPYTDVHNISRKLYRRMRHRRAFDTIITPLPCSSRMTTCQAPYALLKTISIKFYLYPFASIGLPLKLTRVRPYTHARLGQWCGHASSWYALPRSSYCLMWCGMSDVDGCIAHDGDMIMISPAN